MLKITLVQPLLMYRRYGFPVKNLSSQLTHLEIKVLLKSFNKIGQKLCQKAKELLSNACQNAEELRLQLSLHLGLLSKAFFSGCSCLYCFIPLHAFCTQRAHLGNFVFSVSFLQLFIVL